jgi:hypothetical protein
MKLRMSKSLQFWVQCDCPDYRAQNPSRRKSELIAKRQLGPGDGRREGDLVAPCAGAALPGYPPRVPRMPPLRPTTAIWQAGVSRSAARNFERGGGSRSTTVEEIQRALEEAGVIFIDANDGGRGARLRKG